MTDLNAKLYFTIGLPRSGKSVIADKWSEQSPRRVIVNSDSIRLALTGQRYQPLAETMVFATKHIMIRSLLNRGFTVMVDGTHSTDISISRILEIDINAVYIPVRTTKETCYARANMTGHHDLYETIDRITSNLDRLGFWDDKSLSENINRIRQSVIDRNLYETFN